MQNYNYITPLGFYMPNFPGHYSLRIEITIPMEYMKNQIAKNIEIIILFHEP